MSETTVSSISINIINIAMIYPKNKSVKLIKVEEARVNLWDSERDEQKKCRFKLQSSQNLFFVDGFFGSDEWTNSFKSDITRWVTNMRCFDFRIGNYWNESDFDVVFRLSILLLGFFLRFFSSWLFWVARDRYKR